MRLKVTTYNIMSGRNNDINNLMRDYNNSIEVINDIAPDIIGLEEVGKHPTAGYPEYIMEGQPHELISEKTGMYACFSPATYFSGCPYGVALLSKYPIKSHRTVIIPDCERTEPGYYETRCVLVAEVDILDGITVLVSHFGLMPGEHINAVETVSKLIKEINTPIIFMGDLNMKPDAPGMQQLFKLLNDTANGSTEPHTWPTQFNKNTGWEKQFKGDAARKIDYIFTSEHFQPNS